MHAGGNRAWSTGTAAGLSDGVLALAEFLTGSEAKGLADRLEDGDTLPVVLGAISATRREAVKTLLAQAGVGPSDVGGGVRVLRAIEGAHRRTSYATPVWTLPGTLARSGHLTSQMSSLVLGARMSVTCATYNVTQTSALWEALAEVSRRPEISVRLYLDTAAADHRSPEWRGPMTTTVDVARALPRVTVLRTRRRDGAFVRTHTKFLAIDHRFLLVTSANFSRSAEERNVELGVVIDDPALTESVQRQMRLVEDDVYEVVPPR